MTTPRDAIAGPCCVCGATNYALSCGGPSICPSCDCGNFGPEIVKRQKIKLDALQGEISQWANEVARYKAYAEKFDEENAALQARVKELEASNRTANKWQQWAEDERAKYESRATSAEQERDEAYERAAKVAEQPGLWPKMYRALDRVKIAAAIRRLAAGTEKEGE